MSKEVNHIYTNEHTIKKEPYDVDGSEIYFNAEESYSKINDERKDEKLLILKEKIKDYCKSSGNDFTLLARNYPIIIKSTHNNYHLFLAYLLAITDLYKINFYLNYQKKHFKGSQYAKKNDFNGLIEHTVLKMVRNISVYKTDERLIKISEWIQANREKTIKSIPVSEKVIVNKIRKKKVKKKQTTLSEIWSNEKITEMTVEIALLEKKGYIKKGDKSYEWLGKSWKYLAAITEIWKDKDFLKPYCQKFGSQHELCGAVCSYFGISEEKKIESCYNTAFKRSLISTDNMLNKDIQTIKQEILLSLKD